MQNCLLNTARRAASGIRSLAKSCSTFQFGRRQNSIRCSLVLHAGSRAWLLPQRRHLGRYPPQRHGQTQIRCCGPAWVSVHVVCVCMCCVLCVHACARACNMCAAFMARQSCTSLDCLHMPSACSRAWKCGRCNLAQLSLEGEATLKSHQFRNLSLQVGHWLGLICN